MSKSDLEKFTSSSLRGLKKGIYEQIQCSLLMKGTQTDKPLTKISTICEAALHSKNKKSLDMETVNICKDVCRSLQNTYPTRKGHHEFVNVSWIFPPSEQNYERYIKPWHKNSMFYYSLDTIYREIEYPEKRRMENIPPYGHIDRYNEQAEYDECLIKKLVDSLEKCTEDFRFFVVTSALTLRSYLILQGEFTNWTLTQLSEARRKLAAEISPQVWKDFTGQEKQEKEANREDE